MTEVLLVAADTDRSEAIGMEAAERFRVLGFRILATQGTAARLAERGIPAVHVDKIGEGVWDPVRLIEEGKVDLVVNTPDGRRAQGDGYRIRPAARAAGIPCVTTVRGAVAVAETLRSAPGGPVSVAGLQERHGWT